MDRRIRDTVLFVTGILGYLVMLYAWTINGTEPNPYLVIGFGGMIGSPAILRADEILRPDRKGDGPP